MAETILSGQRDTLNIETSRKKTDAEPKIALFDPQSTPLVTALYTIGREYNKDGNGRVAVSGVPLMKAVASNPEFTWWEDELIGFKSSINLAAGYSASATSLVVDDGSAFGANDVVLVSRTAEIMEIDEVATNTLTVRRGVGNSGTGVALLDNDELIVIGSAYPEGASSNSGRSTKEVKGFNYTQIQRTPIEETRTFSKTELWTGADWVFEVKKQGIEHLKKIERTLWYGKREESTNTTNNAAGKPKRYTGGIIGQFIQTNVTTFNGTMTEADFNSYLEAQLARGSSMKYTFCAPRVLSVISNFAQGRLKTVQDEKIYGMSIQEYQSPHGLVKLVRQPIFAETSQYAGTMVTIDMNNLKYRYLQDSDVALLQNRQQNDVDGRKAEYLSETGLQMMLEKEAGMANGITN